MQVEPGYYRNSTSNDIEIPTYRNYHEHHNNYQYSILSCQTYQRNVVKIYQIVCRILKGRGWGVVSLFLPLLTVL